MFIYGMEYAVIGWNLFTLVCMCVSVRVRAHICTAALISSTMNRMDREMTKFMWNWKWAHFLA